MCIRCSTGVPLSPQKDKQRHWKTMALLFHYLYYFKPFKKCQNRYQVFDRNPIHSTKDK